MLRSRLSACLYITKIKKHSINERVFYQIYNYITINSYLSQKYYKKNSRSSISNLEIKAKCKPVYYIGNINKN